MPRKSVRIALIALALVVLAVAGGFGLQKLSDVLIQWRADSLAEQADAAVAAGSQERAIRLLVRYVDFRPDDIERQTQLARLMSDWATTRTLSPTDVQLARNSFVAALARNENDDDLREKFIQFLLQNNDKGLALRQIDMLWQRTAGVKDDATVTRIGLWLARAAVAAGEFGKAEEVLAQLIEVPRGTAVPTGRAEAFELQATIVAGPGGQPLTAEHILVRMTEVYPNDARSWTRLGSLYLSNGKLAEGAKAMARARALDPLAPEPALFDVHSALARKDFDTAERILAGTLRDVPPSESLVSARAQLAAAREGPEASARILREGLAAFPSSRWIALALVDAVFETGNAEELRRLRGDLLTTFDVESAVARYAAACLAMTERRWLDAVDLWNRLREAEAANRPLARRIDLALAACQGALGRTDEAAAIRRRLADADPASPLGMLAAATALESEGRIAEALELYEAVVGTLPPETLAAMPTVQTKLLRLRLADQKARPEEARDWATVDALFDDLAGSPAFPTADLERLRVEVLSAKGDLEGAIAAARAAEAANPGDPATVALLAETLAAGARGNDALAEIAAAPETVRDTRESLGIEIALAATEPRGKPAGWLADIERRAEALPEPAATDVARQLFTLFVARGDGAEAARFGARILAASPDESGVRLTLLELAAERDDPEGVAAQAKGLVERFGRESPEGRVATATEQVVAIRKRLGDEPGGGTAPDSLSGGEWRTLEAARATLAGLAAERPEWPDIHRLLALVAEAEGDRDAMIGRLRHAAALEQMPIAKRRLATALLAADRVAEARQVVDSMQGAGGPEVDRIRVALLVADGDRDGALRMAEAITPPDCRDPAQLEWYASFMARNGRPKEAETACRRAIAAAPDVAAPWIMLLRLQAADGRARDAEATRRAGLAALGGEQSWRFEEAEAVVFGRLDAFAGRLLAAIDTDPNDLVAARRLISVILRHGRPEDARRELERLVELDSARGTPTLAWARRRLAELLADGPGQAGIDAALDVLSKNLDDDGTQSPVDAALAARLLLARSDPASWRRGLGLMEQLAAQHPLTVADRVLCAKVKAALDPRRRPEARADLSAMLEAGEGDPDMLITLVGMCLDDGQTGDAGHWLEPLREIAPNAPPTLALETRLALATGDRPGASRIIGRLLSAGTTDAAWRLKTAAIADDLGFHAEAGEVYAALADTTPEAVLAQARSLGEQHRAAEAITLAETVREKVPPVPLLGTLVSILSQTRDEDAVDRIVRLAESIAGEHEATPEVGLLRAVVQTIAGRKAEAEAMFTELLDSGVLQGNRLGGAKANLAYLLARPDTAEKANRLIDEAIVELGPQPELLDTRAVIRHIRGQTPQALEDMAEALVQPTALRHLHHASILADSGDLDAAREALDRAKTLGLDDERLVADDLVRRVRVEAAISKAAAAR